MWYIYVDYSSFCVIWMSVFWIFILSSYDSDLLEELEDYY